MFANVAKTTEFDPDLEAVLKRGCFASCLVEPDGRVCILPATICPNAAKVAFFTHNGSGTCCRSAIGLRNETSFELKVSRIRPKIDQLISNWFNGCVLGSATELFKIPNLILPERHQKVQSSTNRSLPLRLLFCVAIEWQSQPIRPACLAQFEFNRSSGPCEAGRFLKSSLQPFGGQLELDHCQSVPLPMLVSTNMIIAKRIKLVSRSAQRALGRGAKQMPVKSSFYADKKPPQPVPLVPGSVA
ncbi:hypothetical protein T10_7852 [Trichinella papuae]|uniref:Uncharacterized protein n=1 Tax=Trichinella papuae TaxID=268474 RepID=A0A0V1MK04_9BILA|nr:hypothetical protein T10_7852 [Trichinella papuae]